MDNIIGMKDRNGAGSTGDPSILDVIVKLIVVALHIITKVAQPHEWEMETLFCNGDAVENIWVFGQGIVDDFFAIDAQF